MASVSQQALMSYGELLPATISYIGLTNGAGTGGAGSSSAAQTISGVSIGAAAPDRTVFIIVHWWTRANQRALSSATIGGVAATIHAKNTGLGGAIGPLGCAIISAPLPTGTTAAVGISIATGDSAYYVYLQTYRVTGLLSAVANDTIVTAAGGSGVGSISGTIDVLKDGILLFGGTLYGANGYAFTGATEDYESVVYTDARMTGASLAVTANETGRAVSIAKSGGSDFFGPVVAASFR